LNLFSVFEKTENGKIKKRKADQREQAPFENPI